MFFPEMTTKTALKITKQKMTEYHLEFLERMNAIEVDAHWFRRAFHTFAASFLFYYLLPDETWVTNVKIILPILIVAGMFVIEYHRLRGDVDHKRFFGLRSYEKKRPASYLYFGVAVMLLFLFFPQQIAIPCILCASFTDPIIGETRYFFGKKYAYPLGFVISYLFFLVTWYRADGWVLIIVTTLGASGAVIGEARKCTYVDDDFMIQILPAVLLFILCQGLLLMQIDILPPPLIHPLSP